MTDNYARMVKNSGRGGTNYRLLTFQTGTLGIDFRDNIVTCVTKLGQAEVLGVRAGWRILEVGGEKVVGAREIMKAVKRVKTQQPQFDILFATPNWVKIEIPAEIGGGFLTMKVVDGTKVYQLKKLILKKCKTKRVMDSPKNGIQPDLHHSCFVITDGVKELANEEIFNPSTQNLGTTRLVRVLKVRKSRKKEPIIKKDPDEKKPPRMISLIGAEGEGETEDGPHEAPAKMEFVRVNIPPAYGGGFITLRTKVGTSQSELLKQALAKVEKKRMKLSQNASHINASDMEVSDSRVQKVIPKENLRPKNNIERTIEKILDQAQYCKTKDLRLTFTPGLIGLGWRGNKVTSVLPHSQAAAVGVQIGWEVIAVNGKQMPRDADSISEAIRRTKDAGKNTELLFAPNKLPPGTEVILMNLKRNARLNGMTAKITEIKENGKYDINILNSSNRISVRGISGHYFKVKHQEQFWNVLNGGGVKIYATRDAKSKGMGYLQYDEVFTGLRTDNWVKHDKGFSPISNGTTTFLGHTTTRKYGVVWPLTYKRNDVYFQPSRLYDSRRRNLATIIEGATKRQQELEKADMKKKERFTTGQWQAFWDKQNKYFGRYYNFIVSAKHSLSSLEVKHDEKYQEEFNFPPPLITMPARAESTPSATPRYFRQESDDNFDIITGGPMSPMSATKPQTSMLDLFTIPSDPFAEQPDDPFATKKDDPFADKKEDPFTGKSADPFTEKASDPFGGKSSDPFAQTADDPFTSPSDPFTSPSDPFASSGDPFADSPPKPNQKPDISQDDFLSGLFSNDTTLVSS